MVNQQREREGADHMSPRQNELLHRLGQTLLALAHECENDEAFHAVMIAHNDLIPLSLDELACEWLALAEGERQPPLDTQKSTK